MPDTRVVLLNDTDVDGHHFGCTRVMKTLREQLTRRGLTASGSVRVSLDWRNDHKDLVERADLLVINGEGTLHHGSRRGRWLLEAAEHVSARGGKVALINALWQDNPSDWADLIRRVDILACRDSRSAAALANATGRDVRCIGDLSMSKPVTLKGVQREGVIVGDSVHANITSHLAKLASGLPDAHIVPVVRSLKSISPHLTGLRRSARTTYARIKTARYLAKNPKAAFLPSEAAYLDLLQGKALSVTGRFHAACLAVVTRTPFVAVRSNSWKIEALIDDLGLNSERFVSLDALTSKTLAQQDWAFSEQEIANIDKRLGEWQSATDSLFDDIKALVA